MRFTIFQESRIGTRRANQDRVAYCYSRDALLMVVADGMGGHLHGEVAAQIAVQYITEAFRRDATPQVEDPLLFLSKVLTNAHHAILDYANDRLLSEAPRTTCVACLVQDGVAHWAHAGDSRLYHIRGGRVIAQTRDHSRVQMLVEQGVIGAEAAAQHPGRNRVFSCLGGQHPPQVEFSKRTRLSEDDLLVLCSDGVWAPLGGDAIAHSLTGADVMTAVPVLLNMAERLAREDCDNLSIIALTWQEKNAVPTAGIISTKTLPIDHFTTQMEGFGKSRDGQLSADLSDEEIERAIQEINAAIQKYSK